MNHKISSKGKPTVSGSYTTTDIARMLNISRPTAVAFLKESNLQLFEVKGIYRVMKADFERWLEGKEEM